MFELSIYWWRSFDGKPFFLACHSGFASGNTKNCKSTKHCNSMILVIMSSRSVRWSRTSHCSHFVPSPILVRLDLLDLSKKCLSLVGWTMAMYIYFILVLFKGRIQEVNDQLHSLSLNLPLRMAPWSNMQYVHNRIIDSDAFGLFYIYPLYSQLPHQRLEPARRSHSWSVVKPLDLIRRSFLPTSCSSLVLVVYLPSPSRQASQKP